MSKKEDENYTREREDSSQVRSIINQLHDGKPSTERSREVVQRPDGTKVVRVTRKRRVMVTKADKSRRARKNLLFSIITVLLFTIGFVSYGFYHFAHMASDSYVSEKEKQMCAAWGAESVTIMGVRNGIGSGLEIESVLVKFPQNCIVESVLMENLQADISMASYYTGEFQSEFLNIGRAHVQLREGATVADFPSGSVNAPIWDFKNVHCDKFSLAVGDSAASPLCIEESSADLHAISSDSYSFKLTGGKLSFAGLSKDSRMELSLQDGFLTATPDAIRNMRINCKTLDKRVRRAGERDDDNMADALSLTFHGDITKDNLYGPYQVKFTRSDLKTITMGVFDKVIDGEVVPLSAEEGGHLLMHINPAVITGTLVMEAEPEFKSSDLLAVKKTYLRTIEPQAARNKASILNQRDFRIEITYANDELSLVMPKEDNGNEVSGTLTVSGFSTESDTKNLPIKGRMVYTFPLSYLSNTYADGQVDPIYQEVEGDTSSRQLVTEISGTCAEPVDDSAAQYDAVAELRAKLQPHANPELAYRQSRMERNAALEREFATQKEPDKNDIFKKDEPEKKDIFSQDISEGMPSAGLPFLPTTPEADNAAPSGSKDWDSAPAEGNLSPSADPAASSTGLPSLP